MAITTDERYLHDSSARAVIDALAPANELAVVVSGRVSEVDLMAVRTPRIEFEEIFQELEIDR